MNSACCCERMNLAVYLMQNQVFCTILYWNSAALLCTAVFYRLAHLSSCQDKRWCDCTILSTITTSCIALHPQHFDLVVISVWFIIALVLLLNTIWYRFIHTQKPLLSSTFGNVVQFSESTYKWQNKRNKYLDTCTPNSQNSIHQFSVILSKDKRKNLINGKYLILLPTTSHSHKTTSAASFIEWSDLHRWKYGTKMHSIDSTNFNK